MSRYSEFVRVAGKHGCNQMKCPLQRSNADRHKVRDGRAGKANASALTDRRRPPEKLFHEEIVVAGAGFEPATSGL
jgi:hypothetical protein